MTTANSDLESSQPLCPEGDLRFWAGVGAGALLVLSAAHMLGWGALYPAAADQRLALLQRLSGLLSNGVWVGLCTGAGSLAIVAVATVRVRRPGALLDIVSRVFACVCMANLVRMIPMDPPIVKNIFDVAAFLVSVAFLGRAAFRIRLLDAGAAVAIAVGVITAVTVVSFAVVWAVLPK